MDLNARFNVLVQGVELAQKKGVLSLENAVEAKAAIDTIQKGEKLKESLGSLAAMCEFAQKSGTYNLHDAAFLYSAIDGLDEEMEKFISENTKENAETEENKTVVTEENTEGIKYNVVEPEQEDVNNGMPIKKSPKKKK